jgi:PAS domain S-box-containing protein
VWEVDAEGRFTFFSDSLEARTGWKPEQLLGQRFTVLAGATTLAEATEAWRLLRSEPNSEQRVRLDLPLPDGRIAKTEVAMTGTMIDGRFVGGHGSVRDISERERLEGDLRDQAAELAAGQERAHLARELHDSVTQALFSMGLTLRTLEILLGTDPEAAKEKLVELRELQKDALAEMRTLIFELRPSSLESDGLVQALRTHATAVQRRTGLAIVVDAPGSRRGALPHRPGGAPQRREARQRLERHDPHLARGRPGAALGERRRRRVRPRCRPTRSSRADRHAATRRPGGGRAASRESRRQGFHDRGGGPRLGRMT